MKSLSVRKKIFLSAVIFSIMATGCYYDKKELLYPGSTGAIDCNTVSAKFNADVLPLITSKCAVSNCHNASAAGGMIFQTYSQISNAKDRINVRTILEKTMPQTGPLSPAEIAVLKCWIDSGVPNN